MLSHGWHAGAACPRATAFRSAARDISVATLRRLAELSPICPLGTTSAIATVDQNNAVTTIRNTEVVSDATNVLALECAVRRGDLLQRDSRSTARVRLAASDRVIRAQTFSDPGSHQHFRLLGLVAAGRDEGSFRFEIEALLEQLAFFLRLLDAVGAGKVRVSITDLDCSW